MYVHIKLPYGGSILLYPIIALPILVYNYHLWCHKVLFGAKYNISNLPASLHLVSIKCAVKSFKIT